MHWLKENWREVVAVMATVSAICTYVNAKLPKDANGYVLRPPSWWSFFWRLFVDILAWTPQPGKAGIFGPVPVNLPGISSHNTPPGDNEFRKASASDAGAISLTVLLMLALCGIGAAIFAGCGPASKEWASAYGQCMKASGLNIAMGVYTDVAKVFAGARSTDEVVAGLEGLGITAATGVVSEAGKCAINAWLHDHPMPAMASTSTAAPSRVVIAHAGARIFLAKHEAH